MVINIGYTAAKALLCLCDQHPGATPDTVITLAILQAYHRGLMYAPQPANQATKTPVRAKEQTPCARPQ